MKIEQIFLLIFCFGFTSNANAQSASIKMVNLFNPSTVRNVYEIIKHVPLDDKKQIALAELIAAEDSCFAKCLKTEKVMSMSTENLLNKIRDENLRMILSEDELDQYYRGKCNEEAEAMAADIRDKMKNLLNTSYQEGKFIYASFYKIFLESKVAELKYAEKPKLLEVALRKIKEDELNILLEKCGIKFDDNLNATREWKFIPNTPLR